MDEQIAERTSCRNEILINLLKAKNELIVARLLEKSSYSAKTVYKNLEVLHAKKLIVYAKPKTTFGDIKRPCHLTPKGQQEANIQALIRNLQILPPSVLEDYIVGSKIRCLEKGIPSLASEDDKASIDFLYNFSSPDNRKKAKAVIDLIEAELFSIGYTNEELYSLWAMGSGGYILSVVQAYGSDFFFKQLPFKAERPATDEWQKEYLNKHVQEALELYKYGTLPHIQKDDNEEHIREFHEKHRGKDQK